MGYELDKIQWFEHLYLASPSTILSVIQSIPNAVSSLALLAHNPGITELAELLAAQPIGDMPTSAVVTLAADIKDWQDASTTWQLQDFDYPKR